CSASRTTGTMARRCSREASSGTTPPYGACVAIWEETTFDNTCAPSRTTAAEVSSHELSMPRIRAICAYDSEQLRFKYRPVKKGVSEIAFHRTVPNNARNRRNRMSSDIARSPAALAEESATSVLLRLRELGHSAYFAGGCVRDLLLNIPPQDFDIATSAVPEQVMGSFPETLAVGAQFGVVLVVVRTPESQPIHIEVATYRSDVGYSDGRHPDSVRFSNSPEEDVQRRDFTVNGLLYDPPRSQVLDFVGGRADLERKLIRAIGEPHLRFREDKLRMMRAGRGHSSGEPRAHSRRAGQNAHGRTRAPLFRTAGPHRFAAAGIARSRGDEGRGSAAAISSRRGRLGAHSAAARRAGKRHVEVAGLGSAAARCWQAADVSRGARPHPF